MRTLLVAVTDSAESRIMFTWLLENEVRPDDHLHILHVTVIDPSNAALPGGDYFLQAHPVEAQKQVQEMLHTQFVAPLQAACPGVQHTLHVVKASQDSRTVGRIICEKAQQLSADHIYLGDSGQQRSRIYQLLSVTIVGYVKQHSKVPLTVIVQEAQGTTPNAVAASRPSTVSSTGS